MTDTPLPPIVKGDHVRTPTGFKGHVETVDAETGGCLIFSDETVEHPFETTSTDEATGEVTTTTETRTIQAKSGWFSPDSLVRLP